MRTVVLDTNVLLADPGSIFAFPDAEIIIPETVLGELDKLKTSRVDPDLRFRGREVSRMLFELSEQDSLIEGVELPDGGTLRVVPYSPDGPTPEGLSGRNADDRILGVAYQVCETECEGGLTVITNDLNMLLKAQTLGLEVERHGDGVEGSWARRYILRPAQRYRVPLAILGISLAAFAAILTVAIWAPGVNQNQAAIPQEFRDLLSPQQTEALDFLVTLEEDPANADALLGMANLYFDVRDQTGDLAHARLAEGYYERYLEVEGDDADARTDLAASYFYSGRTDQAIQEIDRVLREEPDHLQANFNLGIFYWRGREDLPGALSQFEKVIVIAEDSSDPHSNVIAEQAAGNATELREEAAAAGVALPEEETF
jgi:tetratricopeptide (TPR) repeat protein